MIVIPAIDLRNGRVVRLLRGDFDRTTEYAASPAQLAATYRSAGCRLLHVVDLDGAESGEPANDRLVAELAAGKALAVQVGGGLRESARLTALFDRGAARAVVGSLAVTSPATVGAWFTRFGPERLVLALDVRIDPTGVPRLATHGWTRTSETTLWEAVEHYLGCGLEHLLCTDVARDGALEGPNVELYRACVARYPGLQVQASGGVRDCADLDALAATGVAGAITGKALLEGRITTEELATYSQDA